MSVPLTEALRTHTARLMSIPGVTGTAEGEREDGTPCILVLVTARSAELEARIPKNLDGHPVQVRATGEFKARSEGGG